MRPEKNINRKCKDVYEKFSEHKGTIEASRDSKLDAFLKAVLRFITFGHLGKEEGKEFSEKAGSFSIFSEKNHQIVEGTTCETSAVEKITFNSSG